MKGKHIVFGDYLLLKVASCYLFLVEAAEVPVVGELIVADTSSMKRPAEHLYAQDTEDEEAEGEQHSHIRKHRQRLRQSQNQHLDSVNTVHCGEGRLDSQTQ